MAWLGFRTEWVVEPGDACHRMNVRQRVIMDEPSLPDSRTAELMFAPRQPTEISHPIATARARLQIAFMLPAQTLGC
jgi:hypothetical protein